MDPIEYLLGAKLPLFPTKHQSDNEFLRVYFLFLPSASGEIKDRYIHPQVLVRLGATGGFLLEELLFFICSFLVGKGHKGGRTPVLIHSHVPGPSNRCFLVTTGAQKPPVRLLKTTCWKVLVGDSGYPAFETGTGRPTMEQTFHAGLFQGGFWFRFHSWCPGKRMRSPIWSCSS